MKMGTAELKAELKKSAATTPRQVGRTVKATPTTPPPASGKARPTTFTLFEPDRQRIEAILDFMWNHKKRIKASEAVRIALHGVKMDAALLTVYERTKKQ